MDAVDEEGKAFREARKREAAAYREYQRTGRIPKGTDAWWLGGGDDRATRRAEDGHRQ